MGHVHGHGPRADHGHGPLPRLGHGHADWDDAAPDYDEMGALFEPALAHITSDLVKAVHAAPGKRILDLACGPGHTTAAAVGLGASALGLDLSPQMIAAARKRFPTLDFQVGNLLSPPKGPWDGIVCRFGVHHVDPAWVKAAWQALRPGGHIALAELGAPDAEAKAKGMHDPQHWIALLRGAGFLDVTVQTHAIDLAGAALSNPQLAQALAQGKGRQFAGPSYVISGRKPAQ